MIPSDGTADAPPLSVEHRLLIALALLDGLRALATHADLPREIRLFDDVASFARIVWQFARAAEVHVRAAKAVLPADCLTVDASVAPGGAR